MSKPLAYLNGSYVPASEARIPVFDAGLVQGAAVSEFVRTFQHRLYRLEDHSARLYESLQIARIVLAMPPAELASLATDLAARNAVFLQESDDLGLVVFVTAGPYATYAGTVDQALPAGPTLCLHTFPLPFDLWAENMKSGARLLTPTVRHVPPQCVDPHMKSRSRMHFYLAAQEARQIDPGAMALLLDLEGNVTETNGANFLIVEEDRLVSPTPANTLPGISRDTVRKIAEKLGIPFTERNIGISAALHAAEALLTSTPFCVMPVTQINGQRIGTGRPGPIYRKIVDAWSEEVSVNIEKQIVETAEKRQRRLIS